MSWHGFRAMNKPLGHLKKRLFVDSLTTNDHCRIRATSGCAVFLPQAVAMRASRFRNSKAAAKGAVSCCRPHLPRRVQARQGILLKVSPWADLVFERWAFRINGGPIERAHLDSVAGQYCALSRHARPDVRSMCITRKARAMTPLKRHGTGGMRPRSRCLLDRRTEKITVPNAARYTSGLCTGASGTKAFAHSRICAVTPRRMPPPGWYRA